MRELWKLISAADEIYLEAKNFWRLHETYSKIAAYIAFTNPHGFWITAHTEYIDQDPGKKTDFQYLPFPH